MKKFVAFYDALCCSIIAGTMWTTAIAILISGQLGDWDRLLHNWYLALIFAICITVPVVMIITAQTITIDLSCDKFKPIYLVNDNKNTRDYKTNWNIYPSEIESVEIVKLSKEEKTKYTSARFLFSKYLKVNLKYGHCKYVYVSHYSNYQIKKIIQMLTKH